MCIRDRYGRLPESRQAFSEFRKAEEFEKEIATWTRLDSRKFTRAVARLRKGSAPPEGLADPEAARLEALDSQTKWEILERHAEDSPPESEKTLAEDLGLLLEASDGSVQLDSAASNGAHLRDMADCCLLYTSPSPRDRTRSRMPSSA